MKAIKLFKYPTLLISIFFFLACSSDDDASGPEQSAYYLTAKIDGVDFSRDDATVSVQADETTFYTISAVGDTSISLTLNSPTSTGTFTRSQATVLSYQQNTPLVIWAAGGENFGSGSITITENTDVYMKGTFWFTGSNLIDDSTKEITEGKFKAKKL